MTTIEWDRVGERRYETGVDRGVLYLLDQSAVPWNGLTSMTENRTRDVKEYYIDGVKYLDHFVPGCFSGKLQAFTYPDELETVLGTAEFVPGVFVHDQPTSLFHLSYRTRIGNDVDGPDHGYKLHILYNLQATPDDATFSTIGEAVDPQQFSWTLSGVANAMIGIRPTSHISLDSRLIDPGMLSILEARLYGTAEANPTLPGVVELLALVDV